MHGYRFNHDVESNKVKDPELLTHITQTFPAVQYEDYNGDTFVNTTIDPIKLSDSLITIAKRLGELKDQLGRDREEPPEIEYFEFTDNRVNPEGNPREARSGVWFALNEVPVTLSLSQSLNNPNVIVASWSFSYKGGMFAWSKEPIPLVHVDNVDKVPKNHKDLEKLRRQAEAAVMKAILHHATVIKEQEERAEAEGPEITTDPSEKLRGGLEWLSEEETRELLGKKSDYIEGIETEISNRGITSEDIKNMQRWMRNQYASPEELGPECYKFAWETGNEEWRKTPCWFLYRGYRVSVIGNRVGPGVQLRWAINDHLDVPVMITINPDLLTGVTLDTIPQSVFDEMGAEIKRTIDHLEEGKCCVDDVTCSGGTDGVVTPSGDEEGSGSGRVGIEEERGPKRCVRNNPGDVSVGDDSVNTQDPPQGKRDWLKQSYNDFEVSVRGVVGNCPGCGSRIPDFQINKYGVLDISCVCEESEHIRLQRSTCELLGRWGLLPPS